MTTIVDVRGREVLDSRGNPTVEAEVRLSDGSLGQAIVPSGASTGKHEAAELRDGDQRRFGGKGVLTAVANIDQVLCPAIVGMSPFQQPNLDQRLREVDGSPNKSRLGANAILAVSMATAHAAAHSRKVPLFRYLAQDTAHVLPVPMFNLLNGGRHARGSTDFQEFMVVPYGVTTFKEALRAGSEIYQALGKLLADRGLSTTVGDEGGFAPSLGSNQEAVELLVIAIERAGYRPGEDCHIALDVAASELFRDGLYHLAREGVALSSTQLVDYYSQWAHVFPLASIEDGLAEDDWSGWQQLNARLGGRLQLVGDDVYPTNTGRISRGVELKASNAVLI